VDVDQNCSKTGVCGPYYVSMHGVAFRLVSSLRGCARGAEVNAGK
jgi:hypothetical protein